MPWDADVRRLTSMYSTNREYRPYDLVDELTMRGLFREVGRRTTSPIAFSQSVDEHVESMHSRNGFSRDRMDVSAAAAFDDLFRRLLNRHCPDGVVRLQTVVTVVWGEPVRRMTQP